MPPEPTTVTLAVASGTNCDDAARITAVPEPTLVTGITSVGKALPSGKNVKVAGTVATDVSLDERKTWMPLSGAAADKARERFWVFPLPVMIGFCGENTIVAVTR